MKVSSLHNCLKANHIDHQLVDLGVYSLAFGERTYKELQLPEPINIDNIPKFASGKATVMKISLYLAKVFDTYNPNAIIVYGDIDPSVAACYSAINKDVLIFHIESGLRSKDLGDSEELNRIAIDHMSDILFSTDVHADSNLQSEHLDRSYVVGNTIISTLKANLQYSDDSILKSKGIQCGSYALITFHRHENLKSEKTLSDLVNAIEELAALIKVVFIQYPVTQRAFANNGLQQHLNNVSNLYIFNTLPYLQYLSVINSARFVITDSSGIQDESAYLGKPCVVCRPTSHRTGASMAQNHYVVGTSTKEIISYASRFFGNFISKSTYPSEWDYDVGDKVASIIISVLTKNQQSA